VNRLMNRGVRVPHPRASTLPTAPIGRRTLLVTALGGAAACVLPRIGSAAGVVVSPDAANRRFSILYKGERVGAHIVSTSAATGETRVTTEIDIVVRALFFTVFAFSHHSEEIWRRGRLMSLGSDTVEHGERIHVSGAATPLGFRVVSSTGPYIAAATALTSNSLWTPAVLEQDTVIDAQHGGVIGVSVHKLGDEEIMLAGGRVNAMRYRFITPYLGGSIWYDDANRWVRGEFERDGAQIQYRLDV
jgi:hypothetical protein